MIPREIALYNTKWQNILSDKEHNKNESLYVKSLFQ